MRTGGRRHLERELHSPGEKRRWFEWRRAPGGGKKGASGLDVGRLGGGPQVYGLENRMGERFHWEGRGGVHWGKAEFRPTFRGRYQNVLLNVSLDVWEKLCAEAFFVWLFLISMIETLWALV